MACVASWGCSWSQKPPPKQYSHSVNLFKEGEKIGMTAVQNESVLANGKCR